MDATYCQICTIRLRQTNQWRLRTRFKTLYKGRFFGGLVPVRPFKSHRCMYYCTKRCWHADRAFPFMRSKVQRKLGSGNPTVENVDAYGTSKQLGFPHAFTMSLVNVDTACLEGYHIRLLVWRSAPGGIRVITGGVQE
eukprot:2142133-Pyramimonas_sp.AAC.1